MINNKKENDGKNGVDGKIPKAKTTADKIDINKYLDKPQDLWEMLWDKISTF